jgi:ubiquinone biosynthesis protein
VSSRAEQLPPEWRVQLAQLQSDVEPFDSAEAERIVESELRQPLPRCSAAFDMTPLAAASTAQVHVASLPSGEKSWSRCSAPTSTSPCSADLNVMRDLTRLLSQRFDWARNTDLNGIMNEYADNILLELDYTNEAFSGRLLAAKHDACSPPCTSLSSTPASLRGACMTQEFVRGVKITNTDAIDQAGIDRTAVAVDLHARHRQAGALRRLLPRRPAPRQRARQHRASGKIIFLDMGMMGTLTTEKRMAMADLLWSLCRGRQRRRSPRRCCA